MLRPTLALPDGPNKNLRRHRMRQNKKYQHRRHSDRLLFEALEARLVLSSISWDGGGDGFSWHDPANWNSPGNNTLPGSDDDVVIDVPGVVANIVHSSGLDTSIHSLHCEENLTISSGSTIKVVADSQVTKEFNNAGTVDVGAWLELTGGGHSSGAFNIASGKTLSFGGTHLLDASSSVVGEGSVRFYGAATVAGTYSVGVSTYITSYYSPSDFSVNFVGTPVGFRVGDKLSIVGPFIVANFDDKDITVTDLVLGGQDSRIVSGDLTVTELFDWSGPGTLAGSGTIDIPEGAELRMYMTTGGPTYKYIEGRTLNNVGRATLSAGSGSGGSQDYNSLVLSNGAVINNTGTFELLDGRSILKGGGAASTFNNSGTVRTLIGTGVSTVQIEFNNAGTVDVGGWLDLTGGGRSSGAFNIASGKTLSFGGTHLLDASSSVVGAGSVRFYGAATVAGTYNVGVSTYITSYYGPPDFSVNFVGTPVDFRVGNTLSIVGPLIVANFDDKDITVTDLVLGGQDSRIVSGDLTVTKLFDWSGPGTLAGSGTIDIPVGAELRMYMTTGGPTYKYLEGRTLNNAGWATLSAGSGSGGSQDYNSLVLSNGAVINNTGTFELLDGRSILKGSGAASAFNNSGTVRTPIGIGAGAIHVEFTNTGTVDVQSGTLAFYGPYTQTSDLRDLSETRLNGGAIWTATPLDIQGGMLTGFGTISGTVQNAGHTSPGLALPGSYIGRLEVGGDYEQAELGELDIDIHGLTPVTQYDQLHVVGALTLRGILKLNLMDFVPEVGNQFVIVDNEGTDAIEGTFSGLDEDAVLTDSSGHFAFQISYTGSTGNDVVLTAISYPPEAIITGPSDGVRGQQRTFVLTAEDSLLDEAAGFTFQIDWGDGRTQTIDPTPGNGAGTTVDHIYTEVGTYTVTMTATDQAGLTSDPVNHSLEVTVWAIQPCPSDPLKTALVVGGTLADDTIMFHPSGGAGDITAKLNGVILGTFHPTCAIMAFAQAGNDDVQVAGTIDVAAWLYGGQGDDRLKGGAGHDVLLGEEGADLLVGNDGRDILIGGLGADRIVGNADDDILISGVTLYDHDESALCAIRDEWTRLDTAYADRIAILTVGTRHDPTVRLNADTVFLDWEHDVITGSSGLDWFFFDQERDRATDLKDEVFANDLDWIQSP